MLAYYHHKNAWVEGELVLIAPVPSTEPEVMPKPGRVQFKATRPMELRQDARIRTTGRIEEPVKSVMGAPPSMTRSHRPPQGTTLLFFRIGRPSSSRQAAFAVTDLEAVQAVFPHAGD